MVSSLFRAFVKARSYLLFFILSALVPSVASAHEVYVLSQSEIQRGLQVASPNPFSIVAHDRNQFLLWGFICVLIVTSVFFFSLAKVVEKKIDRPLLSLKKYAPLAARLTFGTCLIASAYYSALFGPELPFSSMVGGYAVFLKAALYLLGTCMLLGLFVRECSFIVLGIYMLAVFTYGPYMLTYANYLGEILINLILGAGAFSLDQLRSKGKSVFVHLENHAFFLLRLCFGVAIIFASYYAKFLHSQLALNTVLDYHLTDYFHFEPLFIVLGALIIEFLIGLFFIIGFEVRFTALVFLAFLSLSLSYFGEAVWPHIVLIGVNVALFMHGYDGYTIEKKLFKQKGKLEPVL